MKLESWIDNGAVARREDYDGIVDLPQRDALEFISAHHYALGGPKTGVYRHGLMRDGRVVGVALWLPPTKVAAQSVNPTEWRRVLSLSRFVVHPDEPYNAASLFLGASIRRIRGDGKWVSLVTYADEYKEHLGTIYKATNWRYVGKTRPHAVWLDSRGRQVSTKRGAKTFSRIEMEALGCRLVGKFAKHKFVMHLR